VRLAESIGNDDRAPAWPSSPSHRATGLAETETLPPLQPSPVELRTRRPAKPGLPAPTRSARPSRRAPPPPRMSTLDGRPSRCHAAGCRQFPLDPARLEALPVCPRHGRGAHAVRREARPQVHLRDEDMDALKLPDEEGK
jgi:hypothetical protein